MIIHNEFQTLSDAELLAHFYEGDLVTSAHDKARMAINEAGGVRSFVNSVSDKNARYSIEDNQAALKIKLALEITARYLGEKLQRADALTSPDLTRKFLQLKLRDLDYEVFGCVFLDNQHRVIKLEDIFVGTIDGSAVYPREVVKKALMNGAAAVILYHNHPSGVAEPSSADRAITERLKKALDLIDVRVLDHLIVGDGRCESFAERGII